MNPEKHLDKIIGQWESKELQSEIGMVRHMVEFTENNQYIFNVYMEKSQEPYIIEGKFEMIGEKLFAKQLNKGEGIRFEFRANDTQVMLYFDDEILTLYRK